MRIAIIIERFPSLSETFISNKVKELAARGHDVCVFCNTVDRKLAIEVLGDIRSVKLVAFAKAGIFPFLIRKPGALARRGSEGESLPQGIYRDFRVDAINRFSPDIVHFAFSGVAVAYLDRLEFLRGKKVVSCRGTAENVHLNANDERRKRIKLLFQKVDAIHCVSSALKKVLLPYTDSPDKIFVNTPCVDPMLFHRKERYSSPPVFTVLSVGRLTFQKGYLIGLLAMKKLQAITDDFRWIIVGEGNQHEELLFHIRELGLQRQVQLAGSKSRDELLSLYSNASVFFLPSVTEGIANVVLEAMSMELPVVSSKCGGMDEVICHRQNGLLADNYNDTALAANLAELLQDSALRERLGTAARKTILEKFDIKFQADKFEAIYQQLAANGVKAR